MSKSDDSEEYDVLKYIIVYEVFEVGVRNMKGRKGIIILLLKVARAVQEIIDVNFVIEISAPSMLLLTSGFIK